MTLVSKLNKVLKKKEVAALVASVCLMAYSSGANAFACKDSSGNVISDGHKQSTVYVNVDPKIEPGKVLVLDLSRNLSCYNFNPSVFNDYIRIVSGTGYSGDLSAFSGSLNFYGTTYPLPLYGETKEHNIKASDYIPLDVFTYLTPIRSRTGVVIKTGDTLATLKLYKRATYVNDGKPAGDLSITWTIKAANDVVIPTGGCDVSSRNVTVNLPDYPGKIGVPLTVMCTESQKLSYFLTGNTAANSDSIFINSSSASPADGVGVQLSNQNGVIATNKNVSLGTVGTSPVSLGLTASYARTTGQVVAGNVQSIIGVTFVYE